MLNSSYNFEEFFLAFYFVQGYNKNDKSLALYKDKGITPEQIKMQITNPQALIEFEYANDYFRGNPLIDVIGQTLGYTSEDLDYLFEHKELPVQIIS